MKVISTRVEDREFKKVNKDAEKQDRTPSYIVRKIIEKFYKGKR